VAQSASAPLHHSPFSTSPPQSITGNGFKAQLSLTDNNAGANLKHWLFSSESGNLYIGTSTDLYATSTSAGLTILGGAGGGTSGFVGIGTSTPGSLLSIQGIANFTTAPPPSMARH